MSSWTQLEQLTTGPIARAAITNGGPIEGGRQIWAGWCFVNGGISIFGLTSTWISHERGPWSLSIGQRLTRVQTCHAVHCTNSFATVRVVVYKRDRNWSSKRTFDGSCTVRIVGGKSMFSGYKCKCTHAFVCCCNRPQIIQRRFGSTCDVNLIAN